MHLCIVKLISPHNPAKHSPYATFVVIFRHVLKLRSYLQDDSDAGTAAQPLSDDDKAVRISEHSVQRRRLVQSESMGFTRLLHSPSHL